MAVDEFIEIGVEAQVCGRCGRHVELDRRVIDLDGRMYCRDCFAEQEALVDLHIDRDPVEDAPTASYECSVCHRTLPAADVYDSAGVIICSQCWEKGQTAGAVAPAAPVAVARPPRRRPPERAPLLARVTCPHCWHKFAPQDILWVARHAELIGDPVAGLDASLRFLPSQFTAGGFARDARGLACQALACPNCHLIIPRPLVEIEPLFLSIAGGTSSGKSCFLAAMTWELRRLLSLDFAVTFNDADPSFNRALNQMEETLFLPADPQRPAKLDKTDPALVDHVRIDETRVNLPRPFLFTMRPAGKHPNADYASHLARVICLYDNAGEHFAPGEHPDGLSMTQQLGASRAVLFLYDPLQDPRFRARCRGLSDDPQLKDSAPTQRQETILAETAGRVRQLAGLSSAAQVNRPLLVVMPKADVWGKLANLDLSTEPIVPSCVAKGTLAGVDLDRIEGVSNILREMMLEVAPEFVAAAEEFSANVVYIPTSALGHSPHGVEGREGLWIRPAEIAPKWATAPFLYMFARWTHDVIARVRWTKIKPS